MSWRSQCRSGPARPAYEFKHSPRAALTCGAFSTNPLQLGSKAGGWNHTLSLKNPPQSKQLCFTQTTQRQNCQHTVATWKQSKQSRWGRRLQEAPGTTLLSHCSPQDWLRRTREHSPSFTAAAGQHVLCLSSASFEGHASQWQTSHLWSHERR